MQAPAFKFKLNCKIRKRTVAVGKYDGINPCLTAATTGEKVFVHNPHHKVSQGGRLSFEDSGISLLNINQAITSVVAGKLKKEDSRDVLIVGTAMNLLVYDVFENKDVFYRDVPDGVNALILGKLGSRDEALVICGGNCTLQGFDAEGEDRYWTVTGDNVCALTLADFNNDGFNELIVGSEDFDIRVFQEDEIISEISESEAVTNVACLGGSCFGYSLANGTIGVYDRTARYWRIKSKNDAVTICAFDINSNGRNEIITGWSNGSFDARDAKTGEIVFKDTMSSCIADVIVADYANDGTMQLIVCSVDGEVRGYRSAGQDTGTKVQLQANMLQDRIRELSSIKQGLLHALKNYENETSNLLKSSSKTMTEKTQNAIIPLNTKISTSLGVKGGSEGRLPSVELTVQTNNEQTVIRMLVVFAEGLFEDESQVVHPSPAAVSNKISVALCPPKNCEVELHIKAFVGVKNSSLFHVFEVTTSLPAFAMFCYMPTPLPKPQGWVKVTLTERISRLIIWIQQSFLLLNVGEISHPNDSNDFFINFLSLRGNGSLVITCSQDGQLTICTDDLELAGEIVQSLANFLSVGHLQATANFPPHMSLLVEAVDKASGMHTTQQRLSAEMSDHSNLIRNLVVRAEDARLMGDYTGMKKGYNELYDLNRDLMNGYHIRCNNHTELLACLKSINLTIQRAGNLRYGKYKTAVVAACREAFQKSDGETMVKIMQGGT